MKFKLKLKKLYYKFLHKDTMDIVLTEYRNNGMKIGGGCRIFSNIYSPEPYLIDIGNNVTISTNVNLITHDNCAIKIYDDATDFVGPIKIGNNCFIGANAIILPGVTIADNCIIAAGSVVCKSFLESGKIIGGNPSKVISTVDDIKNKNIDKKFNFKGLSSSEKKQKILTNRDKWLIK